jgi:hypothetical protein
MTIRPCKCGHTPQFVHAKHGDIRTMQLMCACGKPCGALLMYKKPEDYDRTMRAGIDGWNLSGQVAAN